MADVTPPKKKKKRKPPTIIPIHPIDTQAAEEAAAATREVEVLVGEVFHPSPLISIGPSGIVVRGEYAFAVCRVPACLLVAVCAVVLSWMRVVARPSSLA